MKKQPPGRNAQTMAGGTTTRGDKGLAQREDRAYRADGWADLISGARTAKDPRQHTLFVQGREVPFQELERLYRQDALMRRIVDTPAELMTRDPWAIGGDTDNDIWQFLSDRCFTQILRKAMKWGSLYGGGIIVAGVDDGLDWEQPLNLNNIRDIEFFRAYDRYSVTGTLDDWQQDPMDARFGMREWYTIYPRGVVVPTMSFRVHHTRVYECPGVTTVDVQKAKNYGWDDSIVQVVYEDVRRFVTALDDSSAVIRDFVQGVLEVSNLMQLLTTGDQGKQQWKNRMEMMDLTRHMLNMMILDKDEKYTKQSSSIAGVPDLLDRLSDQVCLSANTPKTVLFKMSPGGMNATGESDIRQWYDTLGAGQREIIQPAIEWAGAMVLACSEYDGYHPEDDDIAVSFAGLWKPTAKEESELRFAVAQADHIYITDGVVSPEEVAVSRFGGDSYSTETRLEYDRDPTVPPPEPEPPQTPTDGTGQPGAPTGSNPVPPAPNEPPTKKA